MSLDSSFRQRLADIRSLPRQYQNGERVYARDDDVVLALSVAEQLSTDDHPCIFDAGSYWIYDSESGTWRRFDEYDVVRACMGLSGARIFKKMVKKDDGNGGTIDVMETYTLTMSNSRARGISSMVEVILSQPHSFDVVMQGLAFRNGFVVPTREGCRLKAKSPTNYARTAMDFAWKDYAHPQWSQFLDSVFRDDEDKEQKQLFLQEFVGLALVGGSVYAEKAVLLVGDGGDGKSVFLDVIQHAFPSQNLAAIPPQMWDNEYYRARLDGIALNLVSELPPKEIMDSSAVKAIISGEEIEARRPRESPFRYRPKAAHIVSLNPPMPAAADLSRGFWRRWVAVRFNRNFIIDPDRREKQEFVASLRTEIKGVVSWALKGATRFAKQGGYTHVPSSDLFLEKWRTDSDQVALYVKEMCIPVREKRQMLGAEELYRSYRSWGERTGHRMLVSLSRFCERLTLLGHIEVTSGAQRVRPLTTITTTPRPSETTDQPEEPAPRPRQPGLFSGVRGPRPSGPDGGSEPS